MTSIEHEHNHNTAIQKHLSVLESIRSFLKEAISSYTDVRGSVIEQIEVDSIEP